ncbi:MAG: metallophosphoesterase [Treponema sp.]|nr:metallophosphoesterase [Treponema sp.]
MNNEKTNKKTCIFFGVSFIISVLIFIWFTFRPGLFGTFHWHYAIFGAYMGLLATVLLPLIFFIIYLIKSNKVTKLLLKIFTIFTLVLWVLVFIGLSVLPRLPVDNSGINFLTQKDELPVSKNGGKDQPIAHYAFASDPHWGSSNSNAEARTNILKNIESRDYDACFFLGDISEVGMVAPIYQDAVDDIKANMPTTPLLVIPGNHDGIVNGFPAFRKTFMERGDKLYFRMDSGKLHLIFLYMIWDDVEFSKRQEKWLVKQLEEIPQNETVIVISHCYVTGSGYYDEAAKRNWGDIPGVIKRVTPILEKYNVDLYLSGHNHFFEMLEKGDVDYLILGAMGGKLDENLIYQSPYSKWLNNEDFGWADLEIYDDNILITVYKDDGSVLRRRRIKTN